jgi:hypothetical protein
MTYKVHSTIADRLTVSIEGLTLANIDCSLDAGCDMFAAFYKDVKKRNPKAEFDFDVSAALEDKFEGLGIDVTDLNFEPRQFEDWPVLQTLYAANREAGAGADTTEALVRRVVVKRCGSISQKKVIAIAASVRASVETI